MTSMTATATTGATSKQTSDKRTTKRERSTSAQESPEDPTQAAASKRAKINHLDSGTLVTSGPHSGAQDDPSVANERSDGTQTLPKREKHKNKEKEQCDKDKSLTAERFSSPHEVGTFKAPAAKSEIPKCDTSKQDNLTTEKLSPTKNEEVSLDECKANAGEQCPQRKKRRRVRSKKIREDLKQQMEFYFCDANLRKDRYMTELVMKDEHGWVGVSEFLKFNKIKSMLEEKGLEVTEIVKALSGSDLLEVSEDQTKIRRNLTLHPIKHKNQQMIDDCTVYVQGLPPVASVDWLRGTFAEFGPVEYVSLPRAANGRHKGFGFVEFAEVAGAESACSFYNIRREARGAIGEGSADLPIQGVQGSATIRSHWSNDSGNSNQVVPETSGAGSNDSSHAYGIHYGNSNSRCLVQRANLQVISKREWVRYKNKYLKLRKQSAKVAKKYLSVFSTEKEGNDGQRTFQEGTSNEKVSGELEQADPLIGSKRSHEEGETHPKRTRKDMGDVHHAVVGAETKENSKEGAAEVDNHGTMLGQQKHVTDSKSGESGTDLAKKFERGCIVKVEATKPLVKSDKARMRSISGVAYVDMIQNDPVAFIRFNSADLATLFVNATCSVPLGEAGNVQTGTDSSNKGTAEGDNVLPMPVFKTRLVLQGSEEDSYWERIELTRNRKKQPTVPDRGSDRTAPQNIRTSNNSRRPRGRQRLQGKLEKFAQETEKKVEVRLNKRIVFD